MTTPAQTAATLRRLAELLTEAETVQWRPALTPTVERVGGGSSGTYADPTATIALDERRLAVRAAVIGAETSIAAAERHLEARAVALAAALEAWGQR